MVRAPPRCPKCHPSTWEQRKTKSWQPPDTSGWPAGHKIPLLKSAAASAGSFGFSFRCRGQQGQGSEKKIAHPNLDQKLCSVIKSLWKINTWPTTGAGHWPAQAAAPLAEPDKSNFSASNLLFPCSTMKEKSHDSNSPVKEPSSPRILTGNGWARHKICKGRLIFA